MIPRRLALAAAALLSAAAADAQTQVIGPWTVSAPDSATLIAGGGPTWLPVHVTPSFVSVSDAFTGLPIQADGYWDQLGGPVVEVVFQGGVTNHVAEDVLLVGPGYAWLSSEYDGFAFEWGPVGAGFFIENRDYWYWDPSCGCWSFLGQLPVNAYEFDLSFLGVPIGETVHRLRFRMGGPGFSGGIAFALARIEAEAVGLEIFPSPPIAGQSARVALTAAAPGGGVGIAFSLAGVGPTTANAGACGSLIVDLSPPIRILATGAADPYGAFSISGTIPAVLQNRMLFMQGLDFSGCTLSNLVVERIL